MNGHRRALKYGFWLGSPNFVTISSRVFPSDRQGIRRTKRHTDPDCIFHFYSRVRTTLLSLAEFVGRDKARDVESDQGIEAASVGALLVEFGGGKDYSIGSSCHKDCSVVEQGCGVRLPRGDHAAGVRKSSGGWIVDFGGGQGGVSVVSSRNQHGSVSEQCAV
jgi:hypothetical protein